MDWPCRAFWKEYYDLHPGSKVVLSVRDANRWYDSVMKTIYPRSIGFIDSDEERLRNIGAWIKELAWDGTFNGKGEDREHAKAVYEAHNEQVKQLCHPSRLLVFEASEGWEPLCAFLGQPVPDEPFPNRNNTTSEFIEQENADDAEVPT